MKDTLEGKVGIVTGAARGIGKACAKRLAEDGASVVIADICEETATATAKEFNNMGLKATAIQVDVTDSNQVKSMIEKTLAEYGAINILINNAGILGRKPLDEMEEAEWDKLFTINAKGTFLCCKYAIPHIKEGAKKDRYGKIINVASVAAIIPRQNQAHYCGSKAAIIQISKVLALELAPYGINVNVLCPGMTQTEMIRSTLESEPEAFKRWLDTIPIGRMATPEDHANTISFLVSPQSSHLTGQVLVVDGGQSLNYAHGFGKNIFEISQT